MTPAAPANRATNAVASPSSMTWGQRYGHAVMNTFGPPQLTFTHGLGSTLVDDAGREYLDLLGGLAVNVVGQAHPRVLAAITEQAANLGHVSNFFATPPQIELAERILGIVEPGGAPEGSRVFLTNSGTEANECALKIVRAHANASPHPRPRILALENSFHGRSTGALALTWKAAYRDPFAPLIPGVEFIPAGDIAALEAAMDTDVAAIFIEPIPGEAGVIDVGDEYLRAVRDAATRAGALMVVDEVQTGIGRAGRWMAHHDAGITPDIVTLAKGLGGGMPIGACIGLGEVAATTLAPGMHGTTFGGNPICAAAALAVLDVIEAEGLIEHAAALGESWRADLRGAGVAELVEVRGRGLLIGLEFDGVSATLIVQAAREAGFIVNATSPTTVRLAPPLVLTADHAATFTRALPSLVAKARDLASAAKETS